MAKAPSPPPAPDPVATAAAQGTANVNTAVANSYLNRINQTTPYGSVNYSQTGTQDVGGDPVPIFSQSTTLSPDQQQIFNTQQKTQQGLGNLALATLGKVSTGPLDLSGATKIPGSGDLTSDADKVRDSYFNQQMDLLQPEMDRERNMAMADLSTRGIPVGSEAWNAAVDRINRSQDLTKSQLADQAVQAGGNEQTRAGDLAIAERNQGINEAELQHNQPINDIAALLQGSPAAGNPTFSSVPQAGVAPTDYLGAQGLQQSALQNAYQGNVANASSINGGLAALGTAAAVVF